MKLFRFPLETVLEIRRTQETAAQQALATALHNQARALEHWQDALAIREKLLQSDGRAAFTVAERQQHWHTQQVQEKHCLALRAAHQDQEKIAAEKRAAYLEARRHRELIERLKQKRRESAAQEALREEQQLLDELAMSRRHRAASENAL